MLGDVIFEIEETNGDVVLHLTITKEILKDIEGDLDYLRWLLKEHETKVNELTEIVKKHIGRKSFMIEKDGCVRVDGERKCIPEIQEKRRELNNEILGFADEIKKYQIKIAKKMINKFLETPANEIINGYTKRDENE